MTPIPLITTTVRTGHNPGDTFIGAGLQYLFEQALGPQRWLLVDRFSPAGFKRHESLIRAAPFLVYGGMPQYNNYDDWMHWYDWGMWRDYILRWGLKVFTMAGGAGFSHPNISVEDYVAYCLKSRKTQRIIRERIAASLCFTVRDPYAHALLNTLGIPNRYLPCSATWATRMWHIEPAKERPYLFLVPPPMRYVQGGIERRLHQRRAQRSRILAGQWTALYAALKAQGEDVKVLCHDSREYANLRDVIPSNDLWYHGDSYTLLREYAFAHTVVSARLHGSLPAYGLAGTKVLHVSVDVRGSAVEILPKMRNLLVGAVEPEMTIALLRDLEPSNPEDLRLWEEAYRSLILSCLPR